MGTAGVRRWTSTKPRPFADRFWEKVNKDGPVVPGMTTPCWEWLASVRRNGYGQVRADGPSRRVLAAHRASWEMANGSIPPDLEVLHRCDNRLCVRPDHLFLGTTLDNVRENFPLRCARMMRGELHRDAKLTEAQVREIRLRHQGGESYLVLAQTYGVSSPTVAHACQRRTWKHVA